MTMTDNRNDNIAPFMDEVHQIAEQAVKDFGTATSKKGTGDVRTCYSLLLAAQHGVMSDTAPITAMYQPNQDKTLQNERMNALLVHVFQTHEYNDKEKAVVRSKEKKNGEREFAYTGDQINALKQSIRRMLPVAAYLYFNGGTDVCELNKNGSLEVKGKYVVDQQTLENEPKKADNWYNVPREVTVKKLGEHAKTALGVNNTTGSQSGNGSKSTASVADMADDLNSRVAARDGSQFKGKERENLMRLLLSLEDAFGYEQAEKEIGEIDAKEA
jgi:hypothetical protein